MEKMPGTLFYRWGNRHAAACQSRAAMDRNLLRYEPLL